MYAPRYAHAGCGAVSPRRRLSVAQPVAGAPIVAAAGYQQPLHVALPPAKAVLAGQAHSVCMPALAAQPNALVGTPPQQLTPRMQAAQMGQQRVPAGQGPFKFFSEPPQPHPLPATPRGGQRAPAAPQPAANGHSPAPAAAAAAGASPATLRGAPAAAAAAPAEPALKATDLLLECVHASGLDVAKLAPRQRRAVLDTSQAGPWAVGRAPQRELFERLVPDEQQRALISRRHFEITREGSTLFVTTLSSNVLLVDGAPAPQQQRVPVAPAAHLGLCGVDAQTPLLVFRLQLGADPAAATQDGAPVAGQPASRAPYELRCTLVLGRDAAAAPPEASALPVRPSERLVVGRQHQPGFFERLLGSEPQLLSFISRAHFELAPAPGGAGIFELTNLSANPLGADQRRLGKGERVQVRAPQRIDFLGCLPGESEARAFLSLSLVEAGSTPRSSPPKTVFGLHEP